MGPGTPGPQTTCTVFPQPPPCLEPLLSAPSFHTVPRVVLPRSKHGLKSCRVYAPGKTLSLKAHHNLVLVFQSVLPHQPRYSLHPSNIMLPPTPPQALPQVTGLMLSAPLFTMSSGLFSVSSTLTLQRAAPEKLPWLPGGMSVACQPLVPYRTLYSRIPLALLHT